MNQRRSIWLAIFALSIASPATSQVSNPADNFIDMRAPEGRTGPAEPTTGPLRPTITQSDIDKKAACPATGCPTAPAPVPPVSNAPAAPCGDAARQAGSC